MLQMASTFPYAIKSTVFRPSHVSRNHPHRHLRLALPTLGRPCEEFFHYHAGCSSTVEINNTFYHLPNHETFVTQWSPEVVPAGFACMGPKPHLKESMSKTCFEPGRTNVGIGPNQARRCTALLMMVIRALLPINALIFR